MYRRVIFGLIAVAAIWLAVTRGPEVAALATTAAGGSWPWLAVAAVFQVGYYAGYTATYRQAFAAAGVRRGFFELVPTMLASVFVNTVTPSAGTAGPTLLVDDAARRGHSASRSAAAVVAAQFVDFAGFGVVMLFGLGYLLAVGRLQGSEIVAASLFVGLLVLFAAALVLARSRPALLAAILGAVERAAGAITRAFGREPRAGWASRVAEEFSAGVTTVGENPRALVSAWLIAIAGHTSDLLCFIAVGFAFGWHAVGSMVAAYAVGIVVWLVSIVPQGVGVVEGAVALLLTSFGAPVATATAISLVFRGMTFWLPFAMGAVALRHTATFAPRTAEKPGAFAVRATAVAVFAVGVMNILSAMTPNLPARLQAFERFMPFQVAYGHLSATLAGLALIVVARGLWNHKANAWALTEVLLVLSAVSHLVKGFDYEEATVAGVVALWLLTERAAFYARSDTPSLRQGIRVLASALALTVAYGTVGFYLLDRHFSVNFGLWAAIRQSVVMFTQFYDPGLQPITGFGRYFADSIYVVGAVSVGYALLMLLRSVLVRHPASAAERRHAEKIVAAHGKSTLTSTLLLPDKAYWFSPGGSVIGYAVVRGVCVVLGDPVGPDGDIPAAIEGFRRHCESMGWTLSFYQTLPDYLDAYRTAGFSALRIGHEAIVDVREFSLAGKSRKNLRNRVNRLEQEGYVARLHPAPLDTKLLHELRDVSDEWLHMMHGSEKRFSLGWFDDDYIRACPAMVVHASDGSAVAFANIVSEYQLPEATIDLMRHRPDAPASVMDFLFVRLFEWSKAEGYETFNLGLAALAGVGDEPQDPALEKVLRLVYEHANAFYGFKGLYAYKDKFDPRWEPRYLIYPDAASLPNILSAEAAATVGGSVVTDLVRSLFGRAAS